MHLFFFGKNLVYQWRSRYVFRALDLCNGKRLLCGNWNGTCNIYNVYFNFSSLLSNNACGTVTFRTCSNTSTLIGTQVVYGSTLAGYQVPIKFKVKHMRVCDAPDSCPGCGGLFQTCQTTGPYQVDSYWPTRLSTIHNSACLLH